MVMPDLDGKILETYAQTRSVDQTAIQIYIETGRYPCGAGISRVLKRNGIQPQPPGRPSVLENLGSQIREMADKFPTRAEAARHFRVSEKTIYRALAEK